MGFSLKSVFRAPKKIFKAAKKVVKSPLFPVIAGIAGPAMLAKYGASGALGSGVFQTGNALGSMGARAALSNAIAQAASGEDIDAKQIALQGIVSQLGAMGSGARDNLMNAGIQPEGAIGIEGTRLTNPGLLEQAKNLGIRAAGAVGDYVAPQEFKSMTGQDLVTNLKNVGSNVGSVAAATAINPATAEIMVDLNQQSIDDYNNSLLSSGMKDSGERRQAIFDYFIKNGYEEDRVNVMLDKYGYASGGRVGFAGGGNYESYKDYLEQLPNNEALFDLYLAGDIAGLMRELKRRGYDTSDDYASGGITTLKRGLVNQAGSYAGEAGSIDQETAMELEPLGEASSMMLRKYGNNKYKDKDKDENLTDKEKKSKATRAGKKSYDLSGSLQIAADAVETAFGRPLEMEPVEFKRFATGGEVEIEEQTDDLGIMDLMRDQGVEYGEQVSNAQNDEILERLFEEFIDLGFSPEDAARKAREAFDEMSQGQGIEGTQVASGYRDPMLVEMYQQYVFEQEELGVRPMSFEDFKAQATSGMAHGGSVHHARRMAGGGTSYNSSSRYSFLIDKYNKGIPLTPSEADELEMLEMTYADQSRNLDMADGGIMNRNLLNTGMDKDMRGGGFIPEGTKEKADDVPARLSKNEFVMTADAVRAAGGGSVNKGAKRMYDAMHQLEAKV